MPLDSAGLPRRIDDPDMANTGAGSSPVVDMGLGERLPECSAASYCESSPNSVGPGARIGSAGPASIGANAFTLTCSRLPAGEFGIFYYGGGPASFPLGNGLRCVAGPPVFRRQPVQVAPDGTTQHSLDFTRPVQSAGIIHPGSTWYFQFWYRDPAAGGAQFNLSDGLAVLSAAEWHPPRHTLALLPLPVPAHIAASFLRRRNLPPASGRRGAALARSPLGSLMMVFEFLDCPEPERPRCPMTFPLSR